MSRGICQGVGVSLRKGEQFPFFVHRTCGRILDSANGKFRMDQYFERMDQVVESEKMPLRIRFMVQDVVDLRRNKWNTRRGGKDMERGPRTIQQASQSPSCRLFHSLQHINGPLTEIFVQQSTDSPDDSSRKLFKKINY